MTAWRPELTLVYDTNLEFPLHSIATSFDAGFSPHNPSAHTAYTCAINQDFNDSRGMKHSLTVYIRKTHLRSIIEVYISLDGYNMRPPVSKQAARPFTLVFNPSGVCIPFNPMRPPVCYGAGPILVEDRFLAPNIEQAMTGDLVVNGVTIEAPSPGMDTKSRVHPSHSSIAIAQAINAKTDSHTITAFSNPTNLDLGVIYFNNASTHLISMMLSINEVMISGAVSTSNPYATVVNLINECSKMTGVIASVGHSGIALTAEDGRNISVSCAINSAIFFDKLKMFADGSSHLVKSGSIMLSRTARMNTLVLASFKGSAKLIGNNFEINDVPIKGLVQDAQSFADIINVQSDRTEVVALRSGNDIILRSHDGCPIVLETDGSLVRDQLSFVNLRFDDHSLSPNYLKVGTEDVRGCSTIPLIISGAAPKKMGFTPGILSGILHRCSESIVFENWEKDPDVFKQQTLRIDLEKITMFGIGRTSNGMPFDIREFKVLRSGKQETEIVPSKPRKFKY